MSDTITDDEIVAALLLPLSPGDVGERDVDYMLALAKAVMPESQEGGNDDPVGEPNAPGHTAVRRVGDVELA